MSDSMNQTDFEDVDIPREQMLAALQVVDRHARDLPDKVMLAQMLGIVPSTGPGAVCPSCKRSMAASPKAGQVSKGAYGLCSSCYQRERKAEAVS